jgi:hypothetical protein
MLAEECKERYVISCGDKEDQSGETGKEYDTGREKCSHYNAAE